MNAGKVHKIITDCQKHGTEPRPWQRTNLQLSLARIQLKACGDLQNCKPFKPDSVLNHLPICFVRWILLLPFHQLFGSVASLIVLNTFTHVGFLQTPLTSSFTLHTLRKALKLAFSWRLKSFDSKSAASQLGRLIRLKKFQLLRSIDSHVFCSTCFTPSVTKQRPTLLTKDFTISSC